MIAPPPSVQVPADLMLYAGLTIAAAFGIGLIALGIRLSGAMGRNRRLYK